jgi:crotonobetainyl-CoA:carnitine CoA-transferase CaiB-like acyl-CoA transferase
MLAFYNIRVIYLTHVKAGPFCNYQLSVMGAEVIKIEQPLQPDMVRADGADLAQAKLGMGSMFCAQNANKKSLPINLKTVAGREILLKLIEDADVVVENYRPGAMAALGLSYDDARAVREDIIYCSLSGFGQTGPLSERTAYDNVIQAYSGLMAATGDAQTAPTKVGPPVLDYGTGIQAAFAIAAALYQRRRSGEGRYIDVAMLDAALMLCSSTMTQVHSNGQPPDPPGNQSANNAAYGCFNTADGKLMLGAYTGAQCARAWQVMGDSEHGEQMRSMVTWQLQAFADTDRQRITDIMLSDTAANWEQRFNQAKVPAARVRQMDETLADPHLSYRSVLQQSEKNSDDTLYPTAAFTYSSYGPRIQTAPPVLGQHRRDLLQGLNYTDEDIQDLMAKSIIG